VYKYVIFDRDGTLNKRIPEGYVLKSEDFKPANDLKLLSGIKQKIFLATNQACINKGLISEDDVKKITLEGLKDLGCLQESDIYICSHQDNEQCSCRKPKPGLINSIISNHLLNRKEVIFIGDTYQDQMAANAAKIKFLFVCWDRKECLDWSNCLHTLKVVREYLNNE
jgi:D-glycero-D-manno-heptose 1,7-bisphosphate phosphatase